MFRRDLLYSCRHLPQSIRKMNSFLRISSALSLACFLESFAPRFIFSRIFCRRKTNHQEHQEQPPDRHFQSESLYSVG